ncbi:MAG: hypothetical protein M9896_18815 [Candidatus Promineofilum sp.]|uniref:hypothetical protein n=1 Tax=Promineifilum sp. TaxID=2664178 RepID=UPI0024120E20|nr:hypothetical protein [Promineifilum sp.]
MVNHPATAADTQAANRQKFGTENGFFVWRDGGAEKTPKSSLLAEPTQPAVGLFAATAKTANLQFSALSTRS